MRVSRVATLGAVAIAAAGFAVGAPGPASAISDTCTAIDGVLFGRDTAVFWDSDLPFEAGDTLSVTWSDLSASGASIYLEVPIGEERGSQVGAGTLTYTFGTDASVTLLSYPTEGVGDYVVHCGEAPSPPSGAVAAPIPNWLQAYGRASADATCPEGWGPSWQPWAEPVTSGWVCTRSVPATG